MLAQIFEELHRLIARHDAAVDFLIRLRQLLHLRFDGREVFRREGALEGEVVIEAVFDDRADGHLRFGEELLHRLREQMRRRVADDLEAVRILLGDDGDARVGVDDCEVSTSLPSTRAPSAALRRPGPMLAATSSTVTGRSNGRWLPSGRVMTGMMKRLSAKAQKGRPL